MICKKCKKNIPTDSVFCEYCGNPIKKELDVKKTETPKQDKEILNITSDNLKDMANHLEFLGYEVEKLNVDGEREFINALHTKNNNILFWEMFSNIVIFKSSLTTQKKQSIEMDTFVNNVNKILEVSRFYYDIEDDILTLRFEAVYTGEYHKETFGQFHEFLKNDQIQVCTFEDFNKLFTD